jgi:hypothetical protein
VEIKFQWNSGELAALTGRGVERAVVRALKKAGVDGLRALRAEAKRQVRSRVRIRARYLADRGFPLFYPSGEALESLSWRMGVTKRPVPLGEYPRRQVKQGVSVEVQRGKRVILQGAFLARPQTGWEGVFRRKGKARYPMGHRLGPSVADSMADGQVPRSALNRGSAVLGAAFRRLLPLELGKVR